MQVVSQLPPLVRQICILRYPLITSLPQCLVAGPRRIQHHSNHANDGLVPCPLPRSLSPFPCLFIHFSSFCLSASSRTAVATCSLSLLCSPPHHGMQRTTTTPLVTAALHALAHSLRSALAPAGTAVLLATARLGPPRQCWRGKGRSRRAGEETRGTASSPGELHPTGVL